MINSVNPRYIQQLGTYLQWLGEYMQLNFILIKDYLNRLVHPNPKDRMHQQ